MDLYPVREFRRLLAVELKAMVDAKELSVRSSNTISSVVTSVYLKLLEEEASALQKGAKK